MKTTIEFHHGSRDLFPEERPVVEAVERAVEASAAKHGKPHGLGLFKMMYQETAAPSVHISGGSDAVASSPKRDGGSSGAEAPLTSLLRRLSSI